MLYSAGSAQPKPVRRPFVVGISGVSKAGKTTLALGLHAHLCGQSATRVERRGKKDKVDRYEGLSGTRVSMIYQDSYFLNYAKATTDVVEEAFWDRPEALNHDAIFAALKAEKEDPDVDYIIFEGFKAFHDDRVLPLLDVLLWIYLPKELARRRSKKSETHFQSHVWKNHACYEQCLIERGVWQAGSQWKRIRGDQPKGAVVDIALRFLSQRCTSLCTSAEITIGSGTALKTFDASTHYRSRGLAPIAETPITVNDSSDDDVLETAPAPTTIRELLDACEPSAPAACNNATLRPLPPWRQVSEPSAPAACNNSTLRPLPPRRQVHDVAPEPALRSTGALAASHWQSAEGSQAGAPDAVPVTGRSRPLLAGSQPFEWEDGNGRGKKRRWRTYEPETQAELVRAFAAQRGSCASPRPKPVPRSKRSKAACDARICFADAVEVIPVTSFKDEDLWWH